MRAKRRPTGKAKARAAPAEPIVALVREAEALGLNVVRLLGGALRTEQLVREALTQRGEENVTEKNLLTILKELPDALEAPSVRWRFLDLREMARWPEGALLPFDDPDADDPDGYNARKKRQRAGKALFLEACRAIGKIPHRKDPIYPLEVLARIEDLVQMEIRAQKDAGTFRSESHARSDVASRYGFPSRKKRGYGGSASHGPGETFREALKAALNKRSR